MPRVCLAAGSAGCREAAGDSVVITVEVGQFDGSRICPLSGPPSPERIVRAGSPRLLQRGLQSIDSSLDRFHPNCTAADLCR